MRTDTTPAGDRDYGAIWTATRARITDLLTSLPEGGADIPVPTVPGATVRDVVDRLIEELNSDDRAGALADRWEAAAGAPDVVANPAVAARVITTAAMAEHDLRTALDRPGARDHESVKVALDELSGRFSDRVAAAGLAPLRVTVEQWGTIIGEGRAVRCLVADRFEFVRAMAGRRSAAEIARWNWGTDPSPYLPVMAEAGLPEHEIRERDPRVPEHMREREFVL